jgi:hypothetical protein
MKNIVFVLVVLFLVFPAYSTAEDFLGAPVIPEGKVIQKTDSRLEIKAGLSHDEVLMFYKEALKEAQDIKIREWEDATYIEDDGRRAWHSITISKGGKGETNVVIAKDNWTWIIGTLVLRYIGVFAVLLVLFLGMSVSGRIISGVVKKAEAKKAEG